jgi:hypothetical protein
MAYYYVQQWWVLPNIAESLQSGDALGQSGYPPYHPHTHPLTHGRSSQAHSFYQGEKKKTSSPVNSYVGMAFNYSGTGPPTYAFANTLVSRNQQPYIAWPTRNMADQPNAPASGNPRLISDTPEVSEPHDAGFSMNSVSAALPHYPAQGAQRYPQHPPHQLAGQVGLGLNPNVQQFHMQYPPGQSLQSQSYAYQPGSAHRGPPSPLQQQYQNHPMYPGQHSQYYSPYGQHSPTQPYFQGSSASQCLIDHN